MKRFNGQLKANEVFAAIYNMIISQEVFADNIAGTTSRLVDMARVDGTLYGDTKLYYATDVLKSHEWGGDAEAANLLALDRPEDPECQSITIDKFRQIRLTVDNYLSKRAWSEANAFSSFNSVMKGWIKDTKRIYDATNYNTFVGTDETDVGRQKMEIKLPTVADDAEAQARLRAQTIGKAVADLIVDLEDVSRDFNDYEYLRSYNTKDLLFIWNAQAVNTITKMDLPTLFHKEGLIDKIGQYTLPARYFGTVNTGAGTTTANNTTVRALVEKDFGAKHCFPGDLLPNSASYGANETYTVDDTILFKVMHKRSIPYMSAFEVSTSFFNPRALVETNYLTFGRNTLEHLQNYPLITVRTA